MGFVVGHGRQFEMRTMLRENIAVDMNNPAGYSGYVIRTTSHLRREAVLQTFSSSFRNCATCGKWGGQRGADMLRSNVQVQPGTQGRCLGGGFNNMNTQASASCPQYVKWAGLH
jgi:hypothetical protein